MASLCSSKVCLKSIWLGPSNELNNSTVCSMLYVSLERDVPGIGSLLIVRPLLRLAFCRLSYLLDLATRRMFRSYGENFSYRGWNQLVVNRAGSTCNRPLFKRTDPIHYRDAIGSLQPMQGPPDELTTARTNVSRVYLCRKPIEA
jgi:hypothetical protein